MSSTERFENYLTKNEALRNQLEVTTESYRDAIVYLASHAQQDTSGGRAAAQVLLSLYNGLNWHMDLTDLCSMDLQLFEQSLIAIRGRVMLNEEPHREIDNGDQVFNDIQQRWHHLHTSRRYRDASARVVPNE